MDVLEAESLVVLIYDSWVSGVWLAYIHELNVLAVKSCHKRVRYAKTLATVFPHCMTKVKVTLMRGNDPDTARML